MTTFTEAVTVTLQNKAQRPQLQTYWQSLLLKNWVYRISSWVYEVQNSFVDESEELKRQ